MATLGPVEVGHHDAVGTVLRTSPASIQTILVSRARFRTRFVLGGRTGNKSRVGDGNTHARRAVDDLDLRVELVSESLHQAGAQAAFCRRPAILRAPHPIVADGELPVRA